ncbi:FGGY-family carbohydrate kinase [Roseibium suaedae]|uniref:Sugar (Pentulose or hexulose) kinase n=1 Tax=Roseibium suaedae TaxID=735517 RepID=A0A1M7I9K1_9HYPH|nr:FGGY-family carbohydrate kinase [Roseibium suaedae]SHM37127.1 Sugar (pentulose or hexulose) kinase [Roseibium suaedae]
MKEIHTVGVIDIGKTNAKVAAVDARLLKEVAVRTRPNTVLREGPYPHYGIDGHWAFILQSLRDLNEEVGLDALSVTTHGACVVLLDGEGGLAAPVLDYEHDGPDSLTAAYDAIRPAFAETGSPRLGMGLNAGAQIFWQLDRDAGLKDRVRQVLTYPQYWSFRLSGVAANEVTSLGCHTDLWDPNAGRYSTLVESLGLAGKMAPVRLAGDCLGPVTEAVRKATGLAADTPVYCGIHDSNASLYPHLRRREAPFSVVSTGTWVIALSIGGKPVTLDPERDTLINVNALGYPVPSARFMGGREFELVCGGLEGELTDADWDQVLREKVFLLPAIEQRSGPFQGRKGGWSVPEDQLTPGMRKAAVSFYLALMTAECLRMIGADGPVIVEGPFARNELYRSMLEAAAGRPVIAEGSSATGTSIGAAMLALGQVSGDATVVAAQVLADPVLIDYARAWRSAVN